MKSFGEWRAERLDEAKRPAGRKAGGRIYVRPDMDRWIKAIEDLAKDLDELKKVKKKAEAGKKMRSLAYRVLGDKKKAEPAEDKKNSEEKRSDERKPEQDAKEKIHLNKEERSKPELSSQELAGRSKPQIQGKVQRYGNKKRNQGGR